MMKYSAYSNIVLGKTWRTEAKAFLLRADATGENRPVAWDSYFNQYIDNLIVYGFFGKMDTFVNTTGGIGIGTATSKLNIIQNAYNALGVNNPNYVAGTGYNTTGTQYINTQFNLPHNAIGLPRPLHAPLVPPVPCSRRPSQAVQRTGDLPIRISSRHLADDLSVF
jgi:hypothetical protein